MEPERDAADDTSSQACALCSQINGAPAGDVIHRLLGSTCYQRRVVDIDERLVMVPSLGGLTKMHVLLCPRAHIRRLTDLIATDPRAFSVALNNLQQLLAAVSEDPLIIFEHGASRYLPEIPCSVEHAHLHVVALPAEIRVALPNVAWVPVAGGLVAAHEVLDDREYLLWSDHERGTLVSQPRAGETFPSQALRKALAEALGGEERWNWRAHPDALRADSTYAAISTAPRRAGPDGAGAY
jgi:diadenosine tetraphosphate (Ap4A) HIT family hydrolase